jgi:hypothetical protein
LPIPDATNSSYKLTTRDAGHRLRLKVKATNAAGTSTVTSPASARVRR